MVGMFRQSLHLWHGVVNDSVQCHQLMICRRQVRELKNIQSVKNACNLQFCGKMNVGLIDLIYFLTLCHCQIIIMS